MPKICLHGGPELSQDLKIEPLMYLELGCVSESSKAEFRQVHIKISLLASSNVESKIMAASGAPH